jgi:hypothetical protein
MRVVKRMGSDSSQEGTPLGRKQAALYAHVQHPDRCRPQQPRLVVRAIAFGKALVLHPSCHAVIVCVCVCVCMCGAYVRVV